eukprot:94464_1
MFLFEKKENETTNNNPADNTWQCSQCGLNNNMSQKNCQACYASPKQVKEIYEDMIDTHNDEDSSPKCICGGLLVLSKAQDCYEEYKEVYCNICETVTEGINTVYHCVKLQNHQYDDGYDLCKICSFRKTNEFSSNLLTKTKEYEMKQNNNRLTNVIISPFSINCALSLALCGAGGNTLKQMIKTLLPNNNDYKLSFEYAAKITANLIDLCNDYNTKHGKLIQIANRLWINNNFKAKQKYIDVCNVNVEYLDCTNLKTAANNINKWCALKTNNLIPKIVEANQLGLLRLLITNAIYFKGEFELAFPKRNTRPNINFYENVKRQKVISKVHMMHSTLIHYFAKDIQNGQYDAVKMYYKNCRKQLCLILVKSNVLNKYKTDMTIHDIKNIKWKKNKLKLYVPKYECKVDYKLNDVLKQMGIIDAFKATADFSNMADEGVWIDWVLHKAFIKVDEKGTEAAAVTAIKMRGRGRARPVSENIPVIKFNHMFNFYIFDEKRNIMLFSGTFVG